MMTDNQPLLGRWLDRLTLDPLDPTDPGEDRYVELHEGGRGAVDEIFSRIDLALEPTVQLLSGPIGAGKTTELRRLKGRLEGAGFTVTLVDILRFVNPSYPIDITELLIAFGLAVDEQLPDEQGEFMARLQNLLRHAKIPVGPGGIDVKREMRGSEPFVTELRRALALSLDRLSDEVASCFQHFARQDKARHPDSHGVVMIVDGLEAPPGASMHRLFPYHSDKLRFRSHHMVYTIPASLMLTIPRMLPYDGGVNPVPIPAVRNQDGQLATAILDEMVEVVARRIPWSQLLRDKSVLEDVILASGGHLGDLMRILQEVIVLVASQELELPIGPKPVDEVVRREAQRLLLTRDQAELLRRIHQQHGVIKPNAKETQLLARLVDAHTLLTHRSGEDWWYEVHPLTRRAIGLE